MVCKVAVIGAGINGLYCASFLRKHLTSRDDTERQEVHVNVDIYADKFGEDTTSDGAAGIFLPLVNELGDDPKNFKLWRNSFLYYQHLLKGKDRNHGACEQRCFCFNDADDLTADSKNMEVPSPYSPITELYPHFEQLDATGDAAKIPAYIAKFPFKEGCVLETFIVEPRKHMAYLRQQLKKIGSVRFIEQRVESFADFLQAAGKECYDIIVNCTGIGAHVLCGDAGLYPSKGQTVRIYAPFIRDSIFYESSDGVETYVIPQNDGEVILGGIFERDSWCREIESRLTDSIWTRVNGIIPQLDEKIRTGEAHVIRSWAGLRPMRRGMQRIETETLKYTATENGCGVMKKLPLIHNYGHGGSGICLAPGSAFQVLQLAQQTLSLKVSTLADVLE